MNASALSVFVFGIYLIVVGIGFIFMPNTVLPMFKFPKTNEPWIRVIGLLSALLGFYYIVAAQNDLTAFFWATVVGRAGIFVGLILLVVTRKAPPMLILFGVVDLAGSTWTKTTPRRGTHTPAGC